MKLLLINIALLLCSSASFGQTCDGSFNQYFQYSDIVTLLNEANCGTCHAGDRAEGNWQFDTYEGMLMAGDCGKPMIVPGDASYSFLYQRLAGSDFSCSTQESQLYHQLSDQKIGAIESWINTGAAEECVIFFDEVVEILDINNCNSCHPASQSWDYHNYDRLIEQKSTCDDQPIIGPTANSSVLYDKINGDGLVNCGSNVHDDYPLSEDEVRAIRDWLNASAPRNLQALPIELAKLELRETGEMEIEISWTTDREINVSFFEVERSVNGRDFTTVGILDANASGEDGASYSLLDDQAKLGTSYYRLRTVDIDGSYSYSKILSIKLSSNSFVFDAYPNPVVSNGMLNLSWSANNFAETVRVELLGLNGEHIAEYTIYEGENAIQLPELQNGMYFFVTNGFFEQQLLRFLVID